MKKIFFAAILMTLPFAMQAQFGKNLLNKAKDKLQQRADTKVDQGMDKTLDAAENSVKKGKGNASAGTATTGPAADNDNTAAVANDAPKEEKPTGIKAYSKFDFVPGDKVLYAEDFNQDAIGELPLTWNSSGKGEVMTIDGKQGKWVRGYQNNTLLSGNKSKFGDNYTVEFDLIYYFNPKVTGYVMPNIEFGLFSSRGEDNGDNTFLSTYDNYNDVEVKIHPYNEGMASVESNLDHERTFNSDNVEVPGFLKAINKPLHYAIQVQKTRFRIWVNETKLFDIPRGVNTKDTLNQLFFKMEGSNYKDDEIGYYLTNIKVASGVPDTRHKLIEEGKFSTTGILFDFQSAVIKPESYGVIKDIANVLKENPTVKVKIVGHTSSDGDLNANMELSKQRAAAVKDMMIKEFGIDAAFLETEGKGPTQPVADNKTPEGKAQNRRVEFIKL
jgi:OOP family OmpA-OmpF porin